MKIALLSLAFLAAAVAQDTGRVYVVTHIDVTPNYSDATAALLKQFAADSRKDPGCNRFEILVQLGRTNHLAVVEVWQNRDSFEKHKAFDHSKQFREKLQPMLGSPFDERLHTLLE